MVCEEKISLNISHILMYHLRSNFRANFQALHMTLLKLCMGHQHAENNNFHHYTERIQNKPKIGPQVEQNFIRSPQL